MSDFGFEKLEYFDDGVRFGTGTEMIAEIKSLRAEFFFKDAEIQDLSRKLEEARGRIEELHSVIEQKNWQIDNLIEFQNVNKGEKKSAADLFERIASLEAALKPFAKIRPTIIGGKEIPHYWVVNGSPIRSSFTADELRAARDALEG